jgi:hypothetical protein
LCGSDDRVSQQEKIKELSKILNKYIDRDGTYQYIYIKSIFPESNMIIKITDTARGMIGKALSASEFNKPALRVIFAGYG